MVPRRDNMGLLEDDNDFFTVVPPRNINEVISIDLMSFLKSKVWSSVLPFVGHAPNKDDDDFVEVNIFTISRLDSWIITVVELQIFEMKDGGGRNKEFKLT